MRAFVYSLDAFVGIVIIITVIYILSLSQVYSDTYFPIAYQAKISASDALKLSSASGDLGNIILRYFNGEEVQQICATGIGFYIPITYGYELEIFNGTEWIVICHRSNSSHALITAQSVKSIVITSFGDEGLNAGHVENPFSYNTCKGFNRGCYISENPVSFGIIKVISVKLRVFQ